MKYIQLNVYAAYLDKTTEPNFITNKGLIILAESIEQARDIAINYNKEYANNNTSKNITVETRKDKEACFREYEEDLKLKFLANKMSYEEYPIIRILPLRYTGGDTSPHIIEDFNLNK